MKPKLELPKLAINQNAKDVIVFNLGKIGVNFKNRLGTTKSFGLKKFKGTLIEIN